MKHNKLTRAPKWIPFIFLAIGLTFASVAVGAGYYQLKFIERARTTEGRVVQMVPRGNQSSPVVRFNLPNGDPITFQSSLRSSPPRYEVEEMVTVRYDPEEPTNAAIVGWWEQWLLVTIMGVFGTIFTLIGIALVL